MVPPERPLVYRKIPRLYRGCARHATGITGDPPAGRHGWEWGIGLGMGKPGRPIRADLAENR
jgi:hypothetical protein